MRILGIVGSPHRDGLTHRLVGSALAGAREAGAETEVLYAADYGMDSCRACGGPCWDSQECRNAPAAREVSARVAEAEGLVLGAPVYFWQVNGLTACLMDRVRMPGRLVLSGPPQGRPALGIAIAGGSGTGLVAAVQSLYKYLQIWGYRALEPLPVSRFNLEDALEQAAAQGRRMATLSQQPFADLGEIMAHYTRLPFLRWDTVDEIHYLSGHLTECESNRELFARLREERAQAERLLAAGEREAAAAHVAQAYQAGMQAWEQV